MRIFATLAVLAALLGGLAASASAYQNCTTTCSGSGYNHTCTRSCF